MGVIWFTFALPYFGKTAQFDKTRRHCREEITDRAHICVRVSDNDAVLSCEQPSNQPIHWCVCVAWSFSINHREKATVGGPGCWLPQVTRGMDATSDVRCVRVFVYVGGGLVLGWSLDFTPFSLSLTFFMHMCTPSTMA